MQLFLRKSLGDTKIRKGKIAMTQSMKAVSASIAVACLLFFSVAAARSLTVVKDGDPNTIGGAIAKSDGETVRLTGEWVVWRGQSGKSFAIKEPWEKLSPTLHPRLVVISTEALRVDPWWAVEVRGMLCTRTGTAPDGTIIQQRSIIVSPSDVLVYCDLKGRPCPAPPTKGVELAGIIKRPLSELVESASLSSDSNVSAMSGDSGELPPPGDSSPPASPNYFSTIADLLAANPPDGTAVELQCNRIVSIGTDPTYGNFFVMGEDSAPETLKTYLSRTVSTTDRVNRVSGQLWTQGTDRVLCVDGGPHDPMGYIGSAQIVTSGTIAWAKTFPDWTSLPTDGRAHALENEPVVWCDGSSVYVEENDRSAGILIAASQLPPDGFAYTANIDGMVNTDWNGERYISASLDYVRTTSPPKPLGMNNRAIGGSDFNEHTLGAGNPGLHNIGLLLKAWGKVTAVNTSEGYFYLDDGSARSDGTTDPTSGNPNVGVRVKYTDTSFPSVNSFVAVTAACGKVNTLTGNILCLKAYNGMDVAMASPPAPTNLTASASNAKVVLTWTPVTAGTIVVYRSTSQPGPYSPIGNSSTTSYTDTAVTNGTTYWYKVAATNFGSEGPKSAEVSATPDASMPITTITNVTVDQNGLMTINVIGAAGTGGTSPAFYSLMIDDRPLWEFTPTEASSIVYDSTQLPNGTHAIEVRGIGTDSTGSLAVGFDRRTVAINNYISEFHVPDDMDGLDPVTARFNGQTNWSLRMEQDSQVLYSTSGTGDSMSVTWDASPTWGEFHVILDAEPVSGGGQAGAISFGRDVTATRAYIWANTPPEIWSAVYVKDMDGAQEGFFEDDWHQAQHALFWNIGYTLDGYSFKVTQHTDWDNQILGMILTDWDFPADVFFFRAHGQAPGTRHGNIWAGVLTWDSGPGFKSGLTAFNDQIIPGTQDFSAIGPSLGNNARWDQNTGRVLVWNWTRRLTFVYLGACYSGNAILPLAFGISRMRNPNSDAAFIGFPDDIINEDFQRFNTRFWDSLEEGATVARAATNGYWAAKKKVHYVLYGNPNLRLW